jgi:hypothetical protein
MIINTKDNQIVFKWLQWVTRRFGNCNPVSVWISISLRRRGYKVT